MVAVIDVHVSGDNSALYAAGGAVFGAIVGASISWVQQKARLRGDRELREVEALLKVVDDGAEALGAAKAALARLGRFWAAGLTPEDARRRDAQAQQRATASQCRSVLHRLSVRLQPDDPILKCYESAIHPLRKMIDIYAKEPIYTTAVQEQLQTLDTKLEGGTTAFLEAARRRVGPISARLIHWEDEG